ncbi:hypothetical protein IEQ34_012526 [Dendrobium chrysotoxum]|uniref:Uncharacterized protein n=1 Tax=Dendrobium chrysotoxum TaxID=161865 RepID=A0AAV7GUN9_DENCH|nr:hypothetical protein IEQ34_012526 [Dendrobium chrysotoxum]
MSTGAASLLPTLCSLEASPDHSSSPLPPPGSWLELLAFASSLTSRSGSPPRSESKPPSPLPVRNPSSKIPNRIRSLACRRPCPSQHWHSPLLQCAMEVAGWFVGPILNKIIKACSDYQRTSWMADGLAEGAGKAAREPPQDPSCRFCR